MQSRPSEPPTVREVMLGSPSLYITKGTLKAYNLLYAVNPCCIVIYERAKEVYMTLVLLQRLRWSGQLDQTTRWYMTMERLDHTRYAVSAVCA